MKKRHFFLFLSAFFVFFMGCTPIDETEASFIGTIDEINDGLALVTIEEGDILASGNLVSVPLPSEEDETFDVGDTIRVGYEGGVRESHPLQINTTFVEKTED